MCLGMFSDAWGHFPLESCSYVPPPQIVWTMGSALMKKEVRHNGERGQDLMKKGVRLNEDRVRHNGEKDRRIEEWGQMH
jgi:hypothetical protein